LASTSRFVCARASGVTVAFAIDDVQEVLSPRPVTRLFHAPGALLGVVGLRGEILPVLDLAKLLGGSPKHGDDERFVVIRVALDRKQATFAVRVDRLEPLRDSGDSAIEPLPPGIPELTARFARGIVTTPAPALIVMDPTKIVALEELEALR
jgi:purine-binding chemotaxis protein CheW